MIRMIEDKDIFACWWWYNWYVMHSNATFESEPVQEKEFKERIEGIRKQYPWIVLEQDNELLGYAYLSSIDFYDPDERCAALSIYLAPDKLHEGYGNQLMKAIIDIAKIDGYHKLVSLVTKGNTASEKIHEKHGFHPVKVVEKAIQKNHEWFDLIYYELEIKPTSDVVQNINPYIEVKKKRVPIF